MASTEGPWYTTPRTLVAHWNRFWPAKHLDDVARFNALVRLVLYVSIALGAAKRDVKYLVVGLLCIVGISCMYSAENYTPQKCQRPTKNNPFANVLLTDYAGNPRRPAACPYDEVKDEVNDLFYDGLYRNLTDVYDHQNSRRQFFTNPVTRTLPNTKAFANFLYNSPTRKDGMHGHQKTGSYKQQHWSVM